MVRIKKISKHELPPLVQLSYSGDSDLIEKYHPAKSDMYGSIQNELDMIEETGGVYKVNYYKVLFENKPIGFFVTGGATGKDFLYSFAINIKFRKKDILIKWWSEVKSTLKKEFEAFLYVGNTRAVEFLKKQKMQISKEENLVLTFINTA